MKALRCASILFFMFPLAIVLTLAPRAWGQQPGGTRQYEDPSGLFKITIPEDWKVQRIEDGTQFRSPDETSLLTVIAVPVGPPAPANEKLSPDETLVLASPPFFSGYRSVLEDKDRHEGLKVHPMRREEFQGHPCLRQDFSYRRKTSPTPRESSAFFFFAGDITLFITVAGTIDGIKISRSYMNTLVVGNAKALLDSGSLKSDMDSWLRDAMGKPDEVRKDIARLEAKWKAAPTDLKVMKDLHRAYGKMLDHYMEKIRPLRMSIATESLRTMKIPVRATMEDTNAKGHTKIFNTLVGFEHLTKKEHIFLSVFRNNADSFACDTVDWMEGANLGTRLDRERSAQLLRIALGLFAIMERHFQEARASANPAQATPGEADFTEAECRLRDQIQKTLDQIQKTPEKPGSKDK